MFITVTCTECKNQIPISLADLMEDNENRETERHPEPNLQDS
jgi:hypothetical protein